MSAISSLVALLRRSPTSHLSDRVNTGGTVTYHGGQSVAIADVRIPYGQLYRRQPAVASVVDKRANALARLTVRLWDASDASYSVHERDSAMARLLADPCSEMTPFAFWRWVCTTLDLHGEAYVLKLRAGGLQDVTSDVVSLRPIAPSKVEVRRVDGELSYRLALPDGHQDVPADNVIPFLRFHPDHTARGLSPLEPLRESLESDWLARRSAAGIWRNGARPGVVILRKGKMTAEAALRLRAMWDSGHAGAAKAGRTAILDEDSDVKTLQMSLSDMQYLDVRKATVEEVCMMYDTPPTVIHVAQDGGVKSAFGESIRSFYRDCVSVITEQIESTLDKYLLAEAYPDGTRHVEFDMSEVLRGDPETKARTVIQGVVNAVYTPDEAREILGLPPRGGVADELYGNQALQPLGTPVAGSAGDRASQAAPPPPQAPAEPEKAPAKAAAIRSRKVISLTGRIKSHQDREDMLDEAARTEARAISPVLASQGVAIAGAWETYGSITAEDDPAAIAATLYAPEDWADEIEHVLREPTEATLDAFASKVAATLDGTYDPALTEHWTDAHVSGWAKGLAAYVGTELAEAIASGLAGADPQRGVTAAVREYTQSLPRKVAGQVAGDHVRAIAGFAEHEGASQSGATKKVWHSGRNPRPSHARVNGQRVDLRGQFSNGMRWPGDRRAGPKQSAHCNCRLSFSRDD